MNLNRAYFETQGLALRLIYRTGGLYSALLGIMDICGEYGLNIERINALYVPADMSIIINISDTERLAPTTKRLPGLEPPLVIWEKIREPLLVKELGQYKSRKVFEHPDFCHVPFLQFRSLIRIPISMREDFIFVLNFWSREPAAFDQQDLQNLGILTKPLAEAVEHSQFAAVNSWTPTMHASTGQEKLELCHGLRETLALVRQVAPTHSSVLIIGETGSGKEAVADAIHELSPRNRGPLIKVNCGAIPENLVDSEFFGYEKGAFTGAASTRKGYFEAANGGTLVLDEIGEMSLSAQVRLLRVLESGFITKVGNPEAVPVNVRIIASTNADLRSMAAAGKFRKDLWYRLSVFPIRVPPLREHKNDIPVLVRHFLTAKAEKLNLGIPIGIKEQDLTPLYRHNWPGNVRELEHVIERALIRYNGIPGKLEFEIDATVDETACAWSGDWPTLKEFEARYIRAVLEHCGNKLTGPNSATTLLGMHYTTLRAHMRKMGIPMPRETPE